MKPLSTLALAGLFAVSSHAAAAPQKTFETPTCDTACQQNIVDRSRALGLGVLAAAGLIAYGFRRDP